MRIAITGGIAEGKSTVLAAISALGLDVASSDAVAREVFSLPSTQDALGRLIGATEAVTPAQVRAAITASDEVRRQVNRLMHPQIRDAMERTSAPFHEVPLLVEACLYDRYDEVWVVTCGPEMQLSRLISRLGDENLARSIIATQLPTSVKLAFADEVLNTLESPENVEKQVRKLVFRRFPALIR